MAAVMPSSFLIRFLAFVMPICGKCTAQESQSRNASNDSS